MIILKYIITFVLAIVSASFFSIVLTVLRCGIPSCSALKKEPTINESDKIAVNKLQKKYYFSIFLDLSIIAILFTVVYFFLKECLIFYVVVLAFYILISLNKTGKTEDNLIEFANSIKANRISNSENTIIEMDSFSQILELLKTNLEVSSIEDIIYKTYTFYKEQGIDIPKNLSLIDNISQTEKENNLIKILELGLGINGVDNILVTLQNFYNKK